VPLVVSRQGHRFSLWGIVRPTLGPTTLSVLVQPRGSRKWRVLKSVRTDALGDWSLSSSVSGSAWRVRWQSPSAGVYEGPPIHAS